MKLKIPQLTHLVVLIGTIFGGATAAQHWLGLHQSTADLISEILASVLTIGQAFTPSIIKKAEAEANPGPSIQTKGTILLLALLLIPAALKAQTLPPAPTPTSLGLAAESDAMAVHYNGEWSAGTLVTESFDFLDFGATKGNHLSLVGQQFLAPTPGVQYKPTLAAKEDHFRVIWKVIPFSGEDAKGKSAQFRRSKRPWQGDKGFMKRSTLNTISEGIEAGGVPVSTNPWKLFTLAQASMMKYIAAQRAWAGDKGERSREAQGTQGLSTTLPTSLRILDRRPPS